MSKVKILREVQEDPAMSIKTNTFTQGNFIQRNGFYGEVPEHLEQYTLDSSDVPNVDGKVTIGGQVMPKTAAYVMLVQGRGMSDSQAREMLNI